MIRRARRLLSWKLGGCKNFICLAVVAVIVVTGYSVISHHLHGNVQVYDADGIETSTPELKCGILCEDGKKAFYVKTGTENKVGTTVCYEGEIIISPDKKNTDRGLNAVFIDGKDGHVIESKVFDTYLEEYSFMRYLRQKTQDGTVVIMASFDEASEHLKADSRKWIRNYGSKEINKLSFRDSYFIIGQRGLEEGHALEFHKRRDKFESYAGVIEKKGCFSLPLGPLKKIEMEKQVIVKSTKIKYGSEIPNCGLTSGCDGIPVQIDTGVGDKELPSICVGGKQVMEKNVNDAGRGFNIVVIDHISKAPYSVARFDTYETNSLTMELMLENLNPGDIVVAVVSDDGSRKLSQHAKETLNHLGSSMIQNLKFRDVWYFIGQVGIKGFTLLEQISFASFDGDWPEKLQEMHCVPTQVLSSKVPPSPRSTRNMERRSFCQKYDGYVEFCDSAHIDEMLKPEELIDKSIKGHVVFQTPIVIIPGMDHNAVVRTMETILMQPGLNPSRVLVAFDEAFKEFGELATLFGFDNISLSSSSSYEEQMIKAVEAAWKINENSDYLIVIEEELILASDFLSFMAHAINMVKADDTLFGASAWNYNGYETTSGEKSTLYRINEFPGLAFLLPKKIYKFMKNGMEKCCNKRAWEGWFLGEELSPVIISPDVSRVYRQPYQSSKPDDNDVLQLFHRPRLTNLDGDVALPSYTAITYDEEVFKLLNNSGVLPHEDLRACSQKKGYNLKMDQILKPNVAIYFHQDSLQDYSTLRLLCKCFGLFYNDHNPPKNIYQGLLRFHYKEKHMLLVGSASKYYKYKPMNKHVIEFIPTEDR